MRLARPRVLPAVVAFVAFAGAASAQVTRIEVVSREPMAGAGGAAGPYEIIRGRIHGEVDPAADDLVRPGGADGLAGHRFARQHLDARDLGRCWRRRGSDGEEDEHDPNASQSHEISRSRSAALSDLPCGSSASVSVTPPPAGRSSTKFNAASCGSS